MSTPPQVEMSSTVTSITAATVACASEQAVSVLCMRQLEHGALRRFKQRRAAPQGLQGAVDRRRQKLEIQDEHVCSTLQQLHLCGTGLGGGIAQVAPLLPSSRASTVAPVA